MSELRPDTHQKALQLNLDATAYGTFAEIGAGQEVARWFFLAGKAAGTVAKSISAYDMLISDAIYGHSERYVSRQRLEAMLQYEFDLLLQRLDATRGERTRFFSFADTVATRSASRHQSGQGWLGVRFQAAPRQPPSDVVIHVNMLDADAAHEKEALGIIGVNLIYGAFYRHEDPPGFIASLLDDLSHARIEVDMICFRGPAFATVDNRLMSLQLVQQGFTDVAMFTAAGDVVQPSDVLYRKPVLVERGRFRPATNLTLDLLEQARTQFLQEPEVQGEEPVVLMEMTLGSLTSPTGIDHQDYLARVDTLGSLGHLVIISNYVRYFRLAEYLCRHTQKLIGLALGAPSLIEIIDEKHYGDLEGGLLEAAGRLFKKNVKLYVHPHRDPTSGRVEAIETLEVGPQGRHLLAHLRENDFLVPIRNYNPEWLAIDSDGVLAKIQAGDGGWEADVPPLVAAAIKQGQLFGYRPQAR